MDGMASYEGRSRFLRWWPAFLLLASLYALWVAFPAAIQWATFLAVAAWLQAHLVPWRFSVFDEGLVLVFPFGRRVFLPKAATTVRLESVGAVAKVDGRRRLGYLLHDGILYAPGQRRSLILALRAYDYRVV
jgi:hypothetical protein